MRACFISLLAVIAVIDVAHCEEYTVLTGERKVKRDAFGRAVAMGGDTLAIGEHLGAYVFTRTNNSTTDWNRIKLPWPPTRGKPVRKDGFGAAVAVGGRGSYVVVGGAFFSVKSFLPPTKVGAAYVYSSRNWTAPPFVLQAGNKNRSSSGSGAAVAAAAASNVIAVGEGPTGCRKLPQCPPSRGTVRVFRRTNAAGREKWVLTATLTPPDPKHQAYFGHKVALSPNGRFLAVAAKSLPGPGVFDPGKYNGSLYIYSYESYNSTWTLRQKLACPDSKCLSNPYASPKVKVAESFPAWNVAFTADTLVVSHGDYSNIPNGFIFTYSLKADGVWVLDQTIEGDVLIGKGLAVTPNIMVEGEFYIYERGEGPTQVVEYHRNGSLGAWGHWEPVRSLIQPPGGVYPNFAPAYYGEAVTIDEATGAVIVGARNNDGSEHYLGVGPGAVYVFPPLPTQREEAQPVPTSGASRRRLLFMR